MVWFALREYQRERILVFLDPLRDPLGTAYNVIQAKIARFKSYRWKSSGWKQK